MGNSIRVGRSLIMGLAFLFIYASARHKDELIYAQCRPDTGGIA